MRAGARTADERDSDRANGHGVTVEHVDLNCRSSQQLQDHDYILFTLLTLRWQTLIVAGGIYLHEEDNAQTNAYLVAPRYIVVAEAEARKRCYNNR